MEDFDGDAQSQAFNMENALDAIEEESKDNDSVKLGSDMLAVSDLAFKEFRERKQTILTNMAGLAQAKYPDNLTARDQLITEVSAALDAE